MGLLIGLTTVIDLSFEVVIAVVLAVDIIAPGLLRQHIDLGTE